MPTFALMSLSLQAPEVLSKSFLFFLFVCLFFLSSPGSEDEAACNFLKTIFKSYFSSGGRIGNSQSVKISVRSPRNSGKILVGMTENFIDNYYQIIKANRRLPWKKFNQKKEVHLSVWCYYFPGCHPSQVPAEDSFHDFLTHEDTDRSHQNT